MSPRASTPALPRPLARHFAPVRTLGFISCLCLVCAACRPSAPTSGPLSDRPQCREPSSPAQPAQPAPARYAEDPHSYANPNEVAVAHMGLEWDVDFTAQTLQGRALLQIDRHAPDKALILDTRNLQVSAVFTAWDEQLSKVEGTPKLVLETSSVPWTPAQFTLGEATPGFGAPLTIELPKKANLVEIRYATQPEASGLQWLTARQTAGRKLPFMYSQSQSIHARSWIPSQDTPGVRVTYDARVRVPEGHVAVMSAEMLTPQTPATQGEQGVREYDFIMPQAVPVYLLALAVGDLERAELGPRSAVWADAEVLPRAAAEFGNMEAMMTEAEALFGPYLWGRYDILVLPPAFPYGGMENPRLTFATPTIIAGDRSLIALIAHELAHSWSGNLVTNSTWGDLWLNEGFTVYFERRIIEALYGVERREMEAMLGRQDLERSLAELASKPDEQALYIDPEGRDPEEMGGDVAYEKGALFLRTIEQAYGRPAFDAFLRTWFDENRFRSVDTAQFERFLQERLYATAQLLPGKSQPNIESWIHGPGLPADAPKPHSDALAEVDAQLAAWRKGEQPARSLQVENWSAHEWLHFLRAATVGIDAAAMAELDAAFELTQSGNYELVAQWLVMAASCDYAPAHARTESFLIEVGRRKFLMPIYKALLAGPNGAARARAIYAKARPGYHPIAVRSVDELMGSTAP